MKNPYNAGGFGEGSRIVVANLLGRNLTDSVTFKSADWTMVFDGKDGIMRRKISQRPDILDGNCLEFETPSKEMAEAIIKSIDYFKHSNNPDFKNLTYEKNGFGFRFLGEGETGNVYLTQRFECGRNGAWEDGMDCLNLIFLRKPDPEKYKKIIGEELKPDRDRTFITNDDIRKLTRYFANEMTDEELVDSLLSTKSMWSNVSSTKNQTLYNFIVGLMDEIEGRNIGLDFSKEKFAAANFCPQHVIDSITRYGYIVCDKEFKKIAMPTATNIFKMLSVHKAIEPTPSEIKKMKVLEEATKVIQESGARLFNERYDKYIKNMKVEFDLDMVLKNRDRNYFYDIDKLLERTPEMFEMQAKMSEKYRYSVFSDELHYYIGKATDEEAEQIVKIYEDAIQKALEDVSDKDKLAKFIRTCARIECLSKKNRSDLEKVSRTYIIKKNDVEKPRFVFDKSNEIAQKTLGEAITESYDEKYFGHWIDKEYLDKGEFTDLLATWLHEICHQYGGDGTSEFTYKLTDLVENLFSNALQDTGVATKNIRTSKSF